MRALRAFDRLAASTVDRIEREQVDARISSISIQTPPILVRDFGQRAGVSETDVPIAVKLEQLAEMRMGPDKPWRPITARQTIGVRESGFVWYAEQTLGPFPTLRVIDAFVDGNGFLKARLFGSIPVADLEGPSADQAELMRYLAELVWAPDAFSHNANLRWREVDERTIEVSADSHGGLAAVRLYFDDDGDICEIRADERGSKENGKVILRPWVGRFSDYAEMGGRRIPMQAEVGYVYDEGYSAYWKGQITQYNVVH